MDRVPEVLGEIAAWSLTSLREKVVKIGAKVVAHGRYLVFQMAEVAVPQALFRRLLDRIAGCAHPPWPDVDPRRTAAAPTAGPTCVRRLSDDRQSGDGGAVALCVSSPSARIRSGRARNRSPGEADPRYTRMRAGLQPGHLGNVGLAEWL